MNINEKDKLTSGTSIFFYDHYDQFHDTYVKAVLPYKNNDGKDTFMIRSYGGFCVPIENVYLTADECHENHRKQSETRENDMFELMSTPEKLIETLYEASRCQELPDEELLSAARKRIREFFPNIKLS